MFSQIEKNWIRPWNKLSLNEGNKSPLGHYGLQYFEIDEKSKRFYLNCLPDNLQDKCLYVTLVYMKGPATVHAHRDTECKSAINWYMTAGNATTRIYSDENAKTINEYMGFTIENAFDRETLCLVDSFVAKDNEVWILDTQIIHDVQQNNNLERKFIQWGFDIDYEDLLCNFV